jgi:hypothetical protein
VVNTPASYSEGTGVKSRPGDRLSWLRFLYFSSVRPGECRDSTLKLGHDYFLPNNFHFIFDLLPFVSRVFRQYSVWLRAGRQGDRRSIPGRGERICSSILCVQTGSEAHPASCTMGTGGTFPGAKARPRRNADHSLPSSSEVENE